MNKNYLKKLLEKYAFLSLENLDPKDQKRIMNLSNSEVKKLLNLRISFAGKIGNYYLREKKKEIILELLFFDKLFDKANELQVMPNDTSDVNYFEVIQNNRNRISGRVNLTPAYVKKLVSYN